MAQIVFNGQLSYELNSFTRDTSFNFIDNTMSSVAYMNLKDTDPLLEELGHSTITSLQIRVNNTPIYSLDEITAHITSLGETLMGDAMTTNLNISFN